MEYRACPRFGIQGPPWSSTRKAADFRPSKLQISPHHCFFPLPSLAGLSPLQKLPQTIKWDSSSFYAPSMPCSPLFLSWLSLTLHVYQTKGRYCFSLRKGLLPRELSWSPGSHPDSLQPGTAGAQKHFWTRWEQSSTCLYYPPRWKMKSHRIWGHPTDHLT